MDGSVETPFTAAETWGVKSAGPEERTYEPATPQRADPFDVGTGAASRWTKGLG